MGASFKQVLPALLQKLIGDFLDFWEGNLAGILAGISPPPPAKKKAQKYRGNFRSSFREKIRGSKKIFRANFVLQTCHPKNKTI